MTTLLTLQDFAGTPVRVYGTPASPLFVAADVCRVLEIANPSDALKGLDEDEKGIAKADTLGGSQQMLAVTESGLYHLIFKSRKPEAKAFRRWVTEEVLPSICSTGQYQAPQAALPEPTKSVVESPQVKDLFALMQKLRRKGVSGDAAAHVACQMVKVTAVNPEEERTALVQKTAAEKMRNRILEIVSKAGPKGIYKRRITRKTQRMNQRQRDGFIADLASAGEIVIENTRPVVIRLARLSDWVATSK